jgi:hypothetical protein
MSPHSNVRYIRATYKVAEEELNRGRARNSSDGDRMALSAHRSQYPSRLRRIHGASASDSTSSPMSPAGAPRIANPPSRKMLHDTGFTSNPDPISNLGPEWDASGRMEMTGRWTSSAWTNTPLHVPTSGDRRRRTECPAQRALE